jgi:hypothetical protein
MTGPVATSHNHRQIRRQYFTAVVYDDAPLDDRLLDQLPSGGCDRNIRGGVISKKSPKTGHI